MLDLLQQAIAYSWSQEWIALQSFLWSDPIARFHSLFLNSYTYQWVSSLIR